MLNEFADISPKLISTMNSTPSVKSTELIKRAESGDIIVGYLISKYFSLPRLIISRTLGLAQGGLWTTAKIVTEKGTIVGYGAQPGKYQQGSFGKYKTGEGSFLSYARVSAGMILIRVPGLNEIQKRKIVNYMRSHIGLPYDKSMLLKTAWDRLVNRKIFANYKDISEEDVDQLKIPLICSNIIAFAYKKAGVDINFSKNPMDVWPKDFIIHPDTIKVAKFIRK